ncbi:MAG: PocR ligand-binding domain-containing protein [Candidatus Korobacteraceae bacterium]
MSTKVRQEVSAATSAQKEAGPRFLDPLEHGDNPKLDGSPLSPKENVRNPELADIIDVQMIRSLMEYFYELVHIPMGIIDLKGKISVAVGWQDICTKFHRVNAETCKNCIESDTQLTESIPEGEFKLYRCKNNMWVMAMPIVVDDWHCGNLFSGQYFFEDERLDCELFRVQAQRYGFNREAYLAALGEVPRLSRNAVHTGMAFMVKLAQMLSQIGYNNLKLARSLQDTKQAQVLAAERETRFHALFDTIPLSVALIDVQTLEFSQFNDAAAENLGYTREEFAKLTVHDIETCYSPQELLKQVEEGFSAGGLVVLETKHRTKSGAVRDVVVYYRILTVDGHRVSHCVWEDVTEKKVAQAALLQSEKLASVGRMAATVAHEINNPLEMVTNCIYLAANNPELPLEVKEHLAIAERELHRVAHIAKRTLGFYRENTKPAVVDIRTLVDEVVELYDPKFTRKDIRLKIEHNGHRSGFFAIAGEIRQVIANLLTNAIDASRPKGLVRVRTSRFTLNGCSFIRVTVADTGAGISRANRSRVFEPFFTTKKDVGTGLGLWVSFEIIRKHKGKIRLRSAEGRGTVFSILLPDSQEQGANSNENRLTYPS